MLIVSLTSIELFGVQFYTWSPVPQRIQFLGAACEFVEGFLNEFIELLGGQGAAVPRG